MNHITQLQQFIPDLKSRRVLDLGCGRGGVLLAFLQFGCEAVGLDPYDVYLEETRRRCAAAGFTPELVQGVGEQLPFADGSFDFINCNEVTEHAEDPDQLLAECQRVLRPDGAMYISFHNRFGAYDYHYKLWGINWLPRRWADGLLRLAGKLKPTGGQNGRQQLGDMHYVTYAQAERFLEDAGFSITDIRAAKISQPELLHNAQAKLLVRLGLGSLVLWLTRHLASTFHFIVRRPALASEVPGPQK
jgi:ubiquinone/menaquinone biosynthesis C-methylase UbiE